MPVHPILPKGVIGGVPPHTTSPVLASLYDSLLGDTDILKTLQKAAQVACALTRAERATIFYLREDTSELEAAVTIGNVVRALRIPVSNDSLAGYCAKTRRAFAVEDAYGDLSRVDPELCFNRSWDDESGYMTRSVACVPILFRGELLGVAQALNSAEGRFGPSAMTSLEEMCRFVGYALYYARMCDELASLKKLEKEKAEFMRVLVHELKSPVGASMMLASAVKPAIVGNPAAEDALARIEKRLEQLLSLIGDVLDLSNIMKGTPLGDVSIIDAQTQIAAIADAYAAEARAKGLTFDVELGDALIQIRMDTKAFQLVVSNLLSNAVKYTERGGVKISLKNLGRFAAIDVADTGMGIPEEEIPELFTEFFRASNARASRIPGSGVGLAGIKSLVERFHGALALESRVGFGSTFRVELPLHH